MSDENEDAEAIPPSAMIPIKGFRIAISKEPENTPVELTTRTTQAWIQERLVEAMPTLTPALFEAWEKSLKAGDSKAMRDVAEAIGLLQPKGGVNIFNQVNNTNSVQGGPTGPSFESIVKKMSEERHKKQDSEIIDAEFEDK